ncbi:MAG: phosphoglucosamine mutase [Phycisphaerae bacterium]
MALIISVSGIRGIVGDDLKVADAMKLGMLFGANLSDPDRPVILASDSRVSGSAIRSALAAGLMAVGRNVIDLGVVSTPGACLMVRNQNAAGAAVITASHNPFEWNGIKLIGPDGLAFDVNRAKQIKDGFYSDPPKHLAAGQCGQLQQNNMTHQIHIDRVLQTCDPKLLTEIRKRKFHVVLDSINGAGCIGTAQLLKEFQCRVEHINSAPTGRFAHTPEPIAANLTQLAEAVKKSGADIGFAQDPDADRLAIVDDRGVFIGEEYTLVLAASFVLDRTSGPVAVNLSTSRMIDDLAAKYSQKVIRTPVGEANVARAVIDNKCPIGGEGNGGVIFPAVVPVRDSFAGIGLVLQLLAHTGKKVSQLVRELPKYAMIKTKFSCDLSRVSEMSRDLAAKYADQQISTADGLRIDWPAKKAWVHIRGSNTEPIIRIIAEAPEESMARELIETLAASAGLK